MFFEFLCKNQNYYKIFSGNKVSNVELFPELSYHLFYHPEVDKNNVFFLELFTGNKNPYDVLSTELKKDLVFLEKKLELFRKTFKTLKLSKNINEYELLPLPFLREFLLKREEASKYILLNFQQPPSYNFLLDLKRLCFEIQNYNLKLSGPLNNEAKNIYYQLFGTITGRLSTSKTSFPILSISKQKRCFIEPQNDFFIEIDFNSTDVRFFLFLAGINEQEDDIHEFHRKLINKKTGLNLERQEAKSLFLSWLYGSSSLKTDLSYFDDVYHKDEVLEHYNTGCGIKNPFDVEIKAERRRWLPLLVQSTAASVFFRQAIKVWHFLKENGLMSKLCFLMHDAIVLDFKETEVKHLLTIKQMFSDTCFGTIPVHVRKGKNFGEMIEL